MLSWGKKRHTLFERLRNKVECKEKKKRILEGTWGEERWRLLIIFLLMKEEIIHSLCNKLIPYLSKG